MVRQYNGFEWEDHIAFGDINHAVEKVHTLGQTDQLVGKNGWPNIRYFNNKTGYGGGAYQQKTQSKVCDELGEEWRMQAYIEDKAFGKQVRGPILPWVCGLLLVVGVVAVLIKQVNRMAQPDKSASGKSGKKAKEGKKNR